MTAIITYDFKKQIIQSLYDDVMDSAERYFIGIGRSEDWDSADTAPTPIISAREVRNARLSLQSIKSAEDVSFAVPRNNWISGTVYSGWNDDSVGYPTAAYYVVTNQNTVYICLQQGKDTNGSPVTSTVQPSGTSTNIITTADGYRWKFLYTITALNASKFLTANYIPVRLIGLVDSASAALDIEQKTIQDAAIAGQITSGTIISGGTGYTTAPSITVVGDGSGASATATVSGGAVVKVEMDNDSAAMGVGYSYASFILSGGGFTTPASIIPRLSPSAGFGADPRDDLKSSAIMFNSKPSGDEGGDFVIANDFRQVVLMKGVKVPITDSDFIAGTGNVLKSLALATVSAEFSPDKTIVGSSSGATAYIDKYDIVGEVIYFHQNETTGFKSFTEGESITETNGAGAGTLNAIGFDSDSLAETLAEANFLSGKVLYIDNRAAIDRSTEQTEDIKVIIQL